jgi:hypothetical protein
VLTDDGPVPIDVPRDREGTFEPQLIGKHERRSPASTTLFLGQAGQWVATRRLRLLEPRSNNIALRAIASQRSQGPQNSLDVSRRETICVPLEIAELFANRDRALTTSKWEAPGINVSSAWDREYRRGGTGSRSQTPSRSHSADRSHSVHRAPDFFAGSSSGFTQMI